MRNFTISITVILFCFISLIGCESDEDNQIAKAQECLDNLGGGGNPQSCIDMVSGIDSSEANVIRCSGNFLKGGLTTAKILGAYQAYENAVPNLKEETLLVGLAQNTPGEAATTLAACQRTDVPSMVWIAALSSIGTFLGGADPDPATAADLCCTNGCNDATSGQMVKIAFQNYCVGDSKENSMCTKLNTAISIGGGSDTNIGRALFCALDTN